MKITKLIFILFISILVFALSSCNKNIIDDRKETPASPQNIMSDDTQKDEENVEENAPTKSDTPVTKEVVIDVDFATDEVLGTFDSFYSLVDYDNEYSQNIVFTANIEARDFRYIELGHDFVDDSIIYFESKTLYSIDELSPEKPFVVSWMEVGDIVSYRGIAFTDENNQTRYFYLISSGEDGSLLLIEFINEAENLSSIEETALYNTYFFPAGTTEKRYLCESLITGSFKGTALLKVNKLVNTKLDN